MNKPTYTIKPLYLGEMTKYEKSMHTFTFDYGVKMHSPYLAFLVQGDGKNILVDTGPKNLEVIKKYHSHVEADVPPEVHLLKVLEKHGLKPEDIDFIICTHLHWDHCQNNDCFPGKKVYTQKREVLYAINPVELHWYTYESPQCGLTPVWASAGVSIPRTAIISLPVTP